MGTLAVGEMLKRWASGLRIWAQSGLHWAGRNGKKLTALTLQQMKVIEAKQTYLIPVALAV